MVSILVRLGDHVLYVVDVDVTTNPAQRERCRVKAWRPAVAEISEVFHAQIVDYSYPPHSHDTWTVLIVDAGAISYTLDRRSCAAYGQTVAILPPGVTHDGRPAPRAHGFKKRVLYLVPSFLPAALVGAAVDQTNIDDPSLRRTLVDLHDALLAGPDPFHVEASLAVIADRISQHLARHPREPPRAEVAVARRLKDLLDDESDQTVTLALAAERLDRSKAHLVRSFKGAYGITPHAYLLSRRIEAARKLLLEGMRPSEAASMAGFYDQSHLTRHFKRHTSVPPAEYAGRSQRSRVATSRFTTAAQEPHNTTFAQRTSAQSHD